MSRLLSIFIYLVPNIFARSLWCYLALFRGTL